MSEKEIEVGYDFVRVEVERLLPNLKPEVYFSWSDYTDGMTFTADQAKEIGNALIEAAGECEK